MRGERGGETNNTRNSQQGNHWLNVKLVGTWSNRAVIGGELRAEIEAPDGKPESRHRRGLCPSSGQPRIKPSCFVRPNRGQAQEPLNSQPDVWGAHQRLAHENGRDPGSLEPLHVMACRSLVFSCA